MFCVFLLCILIFLYFVSVYAVCSVGGHFNPKSTRHGSPDDKENERVCLLHNMLSDKHWVLCSGTELNITSICLVAPKLCYICFSLLSITINWIHMLTGLGTSWVIVYSQSNYCFLFSVVLCGRTVLVACHH
jgi:hypothetical protein